MQRANKRVEGVSLECLAGISPCIASPRVVRVGLWRSASQPGLAQRPHPRPAAAIGCPPIRAVLPTFATPSPTTAFQTCAHVHAHTHASPQHHLPPSSAVSLAACPPAATLLCPRPWPQCDSKHLPCNPNRHSFHVGTTARRHVWPTARPALPPHCAGTPPQSLYTTHTLENRPLASRISSAYPHPSPSCFARPPPYRYYSSSPLCYCCFRRCQLQSSTAFLSPPIAVFTSVCWATATMESVMGL